MDQEQSSSPSSEQPEEPGAPEPDTETQKSPDSPGYALPAGYAAQPANPAAGSPRRPRRPVPPRVISLGLAVIVIGGGAFVAHLHSAKRASNGQINHQGTLHVTDLKLGDCFNNPSNANGKSGATVDSVKAIPCTSPHDAQIFATFNLTEGSSASYPGDSKVQDEGTKGCNTRLGSLDKNKVTKQMTVRFLVPEEDSWEDGDRGVSCLVVNPAATLKSSLLKG